MIRRQTLLALALMPLMAQAGGNHGGGHEAMTGSPGNPAEVDRTIEVTMNDQMRFDPESIQVEAGQTVRFAVTNTGQQPHEMVIGTLDELKAHAEEMRRNPGMKHEEPNMVRLDGGETGEIVWHFASPGEVDFACLIPGHLEAGMKGTVDVQATP
ncbi:MULTISPECIES: cupredoxin family protein [unclassified Guyparkeria]|uniref:cupredoxin domain-containing protein n=1 Tax=unclassified Guyparkeria TaxID=2626246 RepID=UPI000733999C|nr:MULTISPECIES: cupredoxin family protein [unclassified Guyparkeria]KTG17687.1 copper-binding protein [Guyparkeria sp. XI15]OAE88500.1 copper-binding protein [Guyparkeria sp. WRN-7]